MKKIDEMPYARERDGKSELRKLLDLSALMSIPELSDAENVAFDETFRRIFSDPDHSSGQPVKNAG